ncbi:NS2 [Eubenangee virus]|uniref:Non-structural protein NS2 n=1 Tax=Eubenangee virus TaxID=40056 RepID=H9ZXR9_9REOV|nr:NS2 [Eubenangee virus]AFH41516.1 NS2 [Eubenangee virus]
MESKTVRRVFTKQVCILDPGCTTICGKIAREAKCPYAQLKTGRVCGFQAVKSPPPKAYILEITRPGAYRIMDGQDQISMMIEEGGIEITTDRWEEWKYEVVTAMPMTALVDTPKGKVDAELKYAKGAGLVPAYTKNEFDRRELPSLPGVGISEISVRDLRAKLKAERVMDNPRSEHRDDRRKSTRDETPVFDVSEMLKKVEEMRSEERSWSDEMEDEAAGGSVDVQQDDGALWEDETAKDVDDESKVMLEDITEEEEPFNATNFITEAFVTNVSAYMKSGDKRVVGLASSFPKSAGSFDSVVCVKKANWMNVPLFDVDVGKKGYGLRMIGDSAKLYIVKRGLSVMVLPAGV